MRRASAGTWRDARRGLLEGHPHERPARQLPGRHDRLPHDRQRGYTGGPGAAENDRCGGPLSTSYAFTTSGGLSLARGRYSLSMSLIVLNEFKYSIDSNTYMTIKNMASSQTNPQLAAQFTDPTGRVDITWGIISAGYDITDHFSLSVGLASYQPAMSSDYQSLRFPFFDLSGGANANNYTQLLVGVSGTL